MNNTLLHLFFSFSSLLVFFIYRNKEFPNEKNRLKGILLISVFLFLTLLSEFLTDYGVFFSVAYLYGLFYSLGYMWYIPTKDDKIDFVSKVDDYPSLDKKDMETISGFFNQSEILSFLRKVNDKRRAIKIREKSFWIVCFGFYLLLVNNVYVIGALGEYSSDRYNYLFWLCLIVGFKIRSDIHNQLEKEHENTRDVNIKKDFFEDFINYLDSDIEYSNSDNLFSEDISQIKEKTGLLDDYDKVNYSEDSLKFFYKINNQNTIKISGVSIGTLKKEDDRFLRVDDCYIIKIKFLKPRFKIAHGVKIKKNKTMLATNQFRLIKIMFQITLIFIAGVGAFWFLNNHYNLDNNIGILFIFFVFFMIWPLYKRQKQVDKKKQKNFDFNSVKVENGDVKLENKKFEYFYNVYSDSDIEARRVLTPVFMEKILKHGNDSEYYFKGNEIYIKNKSNLRQRLFDNNRDLFENINEYVKLYKLIKQVKSIVNDLGLYYYDKESFSKQKNY